jgi:hypothetical protein
MSTRSPEAISATSSAPRPRKPSLFGSKYALANTPEGSLGSWGGVLLKPWMPRAGGWHENEQQRAGTFVPAEVTSRWPLSNRLAMHKNGFIQFFETAREAEMITGHQPEVTAAIQRDPTRARVNADVLRDRLALARAAKAQKRLDAGAVTEVAAS